MDAAVARMHIAMAAAKPTGDPDRDFAAMMIPHHQGAIDMAEIQLRFGRDERLRRLAQASATVLRPNPIRSRLIPPGPGCLGTAPNT